MCLISELGLTLTLAHYHYAAHVLVSHCCTDYRCHHRCLEPPARCDPLQPSWEKLIDKTPGSSLLVVMGCGTSVATETRVVNRVETGTAVLLLCLS